MPRGPIDLVLVRFDEQGISPKVAENIRTLVEAGTIRIIDLMFVTKESEDAVTVIELGDLDDDVYSAWNDIVDSVDDLLTADDAVLLADQLNIGESAVLALYENTWAAEMVRLIKDANGEILVSDRIPRVVIDQLMPVQ